MRFLAPAISRREAKSSSTAILDLGNVRLIAESQPEKSRDIFFVEQILKFSHDILSSV
jgi:hypothetical protein